jgi:hypothetical protein
MIENKTKYIILVVFCLLLLLVIIMLSAKDLNIFNAEKAETINNKADNSNYNAGDIANSNEGFKKGQTKSETKVNPHVQGNDMNDAEINKNSDESATKANSQKRNLTGNKNGTDINEGILFGTTTCNNKPLMGTKIKAIYSSGNAFSKAIKKGYQKETVSDEEGKYKFTLIPGCYMVAVHDSRCFANAPQVVNLQNGDRIEVNFDLKPIGNGKLNGVIKLSSQDDAVSLNNASILLVENAQPDRAPLRLKCRTNENGEFQFPYLPEKSKFDIYADIPGYASRVIRNTPSGKTDIQIEFNIKSAVLNGTVEKVKIDTPVLAVIELVPIRTAGENDSYTIFSDKQQTIKLEKGTLPQFFIEDIDPGKYDLRVTLPNRPYGILKNISLKEGETKEVNVSIPNAAKLSGNVYYTDDSNERSNRPATGAMVQITAEESIYGHRQVIADNSGNYSMENITPASYKITAIKGTMECMEGPRTINLREGDAEQLNFTFKSGAGITGRVQFSRNADYGNFEVIAEKTGGGRAKTKVAKNGYYSFSDFAPGSYIFTLIDAEGSGGMCMMRFYSIEEGKAYFIEFDFTNCVNFSGSACLEGKYVLNNTFSLANEEMAFICRLSSDGKINEDMIPAGAYTANFTYVDEAGKYWALRKTVDLTGSKFIDFDFKSEEKIETTTPSIHIPEK